MFFLLPGGERFEIPRKEYIVDRFDRLLDFNLTRSTGAFRLLRHALKTSKSCLGMD